MKKLYLCIENLHCAGCGSKIEDEISKLTGVEEASIGFISKKLTMTLNEKADENEIIKEASFIADKIEAGVVLKRLCDDVSVESLEVLIRAEGERFGDMREKPDEDVKVGAEKSRNRDFYKTLVRMAAGIIFYVSALLLHPEKPGDIILFASAYLIIGGDILIAAARNIVRRNPFDEHILMGIATLCAFAMGEYPEAVAVVLFYKIGETVQEMAVERSRRAIDSLMDIKPDYANLILESDSESVKVSPRSVKIGDKILIKPGERVPLDAVVLSGNSLIDMSVITGESTPQRVEEADRIFSGSINLNGLLKAEVKKTHGDSTATRIIQLVENAAENKAETQKFITRFAKYYTPAVVGLAVCTAFIPPLVFGMNTFNEWLYRSLIFMVVSCPCALVLSVPIGFMGGIGLASKNGILVKGGNFLESLDNVGAVIFDKTGTLTKGEFKVVKVSPVADVSECDILKTAVMLERNSNHPIGRSIVEAYRKSVDFDEEAFVLEVEDYEEVHGKGVKASHKGDLIIVGSRKMLGEFGITALSENAYGTHVYVVKGGNLMGCILIEDEIKDDSKEGTDAIKSLGISRIVMLSGDKEETVRSVAKRVGIDEVFAELLPGDKVEILEKIEREVKSTDPSKKVVFVGDGINDAPVIMRSDIGIAMGAVGSDAAVESADIVIMSDEICKISYGIKIARITKRIVWQNIIFALTVKAIVMLMGASGIADIREAVFADVGVALIAVLNSVRILSYKIDKR